MKQSTETHIGKRLLALTLALVLLLQAAPHASISAKAVEAESVTAETASPTEEELIPQIEETESIQEETVAATEDTQHEAEEAVPTSEATEPVTEETIPETEATESVTEEIAPETEATESATEETVPEGTESGAEATVPETESTEPTEEETVPETEEPEEEDPYALLTLADEGYIEVTNAEQLLNGIPAGSVYALAGDIVMDSDQQIGVVAGILDGQGHTITISGKVLAKEVTGIIQNLHVVGSASIDSEQGSITDFLNGGTIQNCSSTVAMKAVNDLLYYSGGLVGKSENGRIYNSYFAGSGKDSWGITVVNGIMGVSQNEAAPSQIMNCYYATPGKVGDGSAWNTGDASNGKKKLDEMKTPEFVELLNANISDTGYIWTATEGGLPVLAVKQESEDKPSNDYVITSAEDLPNEIPEGITYELGADITLDADQQIALVAGTLDGKGYTITISGKVLAKKVTGTVQNLHIAGSASIDSEQGSITDFLNGGTIQNCSSTVAMKAVNDLLYYSGGLVGKSENGRIYNSYFAGSGKDSWGITVINGIMGVSQNEAAPSQIMNCYYATPGKVGDGSAWNTGDASNGKKKLDEMKTPEFVELLNASKLGSGYIWAAVDGQLPKLVPGGGTVEPCNKKELEAVIQEAQGKNQSDYTNETWTAMQEALDAAEKLVVKIDASQAEVDEAVKVLRKAIDDLAKKERELCPVELPEDGVILISSQEDFEKLKNGNAESFYQLTQDIVIEGNFWSRDLVGVFDGNGHTITVRTASPLFNNIVETGVVQNLRVKAEGNFTNRQEYAPYAKRLKGGMIVNCISEVTGQHSTGFVRKMEDGVMVNCLTMGHNRRGALVFFQKSTDHRNTNGYKSGKFYNCYWSASNSAENITPVENLVNCEPVGDERLRSADFIAQLNSQKGEFGTEWGRGANGYPYFGADQGDHVIDGSQNRYAVQFVWHDGQVMDIEKGNLEFSPQMTDSGRFAGMFQLKDVPEDSTIVWSCDDRSNQEIMQVEESGKLFIYHDGGGIVHGIERKADGSEELVAEIRVVSASREIEQLRLLLDGKVIEGSATVQGSGYQTLAVQAKYTGSDGFQPIPAYLVELTSGNPDVLRTDYNTASFYFAKPDTCDLTVTEKTQKEHPVSIKVSITSEYVPVKSVKPAISGTVEIHTRNSMGSGQFNSIPQTVFVEPANASYKNQLTVSSSDPAVAEFANQAYTPYKNGMVTFTAKLTDLDVTKEGTSKVSFVYTNPLTEVTAPEKPIVLEQGAKQILPLTFKGQPDNRHEVTEPDLTWTFSKDGIVSISRPNPLVQIRNTGGPDDGNWVASTEFEVRALRPGTVVATGTPVDTTGGAQPVTLTITVKKGDGEIEGFDIPKFIEDGKKAAIGYLNSNNSYSFGEEWIIYTLLRDGQNLPQAQLDKYYSDVVTNVHGWKSNILATEVERTALALNIMGKDITNVDGVNLMTLICNHPDLTKQGSNSLAWALLALDMKNTEIPDGMKWSREKLVSELLTYQNPDGGFGLDKSGTSGIDTTAMSLQALARYQNWAGVAPAIQKAVAYLQNVAEKNLNLGNAESIAQVIITLAVLNRDIVADPGFGDEMENIMTALSDYMVAGEGFKHDKNGKVDKMATLQSMQALCAYERFLNGQSGYWDLDGTSQIESPAEKVSKMIAALPEQITENDRQVVAAARNAYEALTKEEQAQVTNLSKLEAAEEALKKQTTPESVMSLIDKLPEKITLADAVDVQSARTAYNTLTKDEQAQVINISKLEKAEQAITDLQAAADVENTIRNLPQTVTLSDAKAVEAAREAYEHLTAGQKELVTSLSKLVDAETQLEDLQAAQKVMIMIKALPSKVKLSDEKAVTAARDAYEELSSKQQKLVLNLALLENREQQITDLKAVQAVEEAIDALPNIITSKDGDAIKAARKAYDKLTPGQKEQVENLDLLTKAEKALKALRKPGGKPGGKPGNTSGKVQTVSNVVTATVKNGTVSAKQLAEVQGKDLILRIKGTMETGETYELSIHGKDIQKAEDLNMEMRRKGFYEEDIQKLSENPEIFRFAETGKFPGSVMVEMDTKLADGKYLLLHYDPVQKKASSLGRVDTKNGTVKFIVEEGGEYFLAKKASKKSLLELENVETQPTEPQLTQPVTEETMPISQEQDGGSTASIWLPLLIGVAVGAAMGVGVCGVLVLRKRKENDVE